MCMCVRTPIFFPKLILFSACHRLLLLFTIFFPFVDLPVRTCTRIRIRCKRVRVAAAAAAGWIVVSIVWRQTRSRTHNCSQTPCNIRWMVCVCALNRALRRGVRGWCCVYIFILTTPFFSFSPHSIYKVVLLFATYIFSRYWCSAISFSPLPSVYVHRYREPILSFQHFV